MEWRKVSADSETQFDLISGQLVVGHVSKDVLSGNQVAWRWGLTNVDGPATVFRKHGYAENLELAKAEVELNWQVWLELARLSDSLKHDEAAN